jgi:23S rRNA pseudouridine2605 synthase
MRINQYLAFCLGLSRRKAEALVVNNLVRVNSKIETKLFTQISDTDTVEILKEGFWQGINTSSAQTVLFYKPTFCVTTRHDPQHRKTIYNFLPKKFASLKPAGRLDFMSEGLLVLSTDGDLLQKLTHPRHSHEKIYLVGLHKILSEDGLKQAREGTLWLDDYQLQPMGISKLSDVEKNNYNYLKLSKKLFWYKFILQEGRNLQIRKVCALLGSGVTRLIRVQQGDFKMTSELQTKKVIEL